MRLLHLSDLHIGKRVNEVSMIEEQKYMIRQIIEVIDEEKPNGVIIAGDIYDRTTPSEEAVRLLEDFLMMLSKRDIQVYIISGNHDSATRVSFMSEIIGEAGIHIAPEYNGKIEPLTLIDEDVKVNIYMLPFIKPVHVKNAFKDREDEIKDYTDACRVAIENMEIRKRAESTDAYNVLVAHQFVTGATTCESEEVSVGGLDNVAVSVFDDFDYVALGHIHGPQHVGRESVRYSGTLLKYSFSECSHKKSFTIVDFIDGEVVISTREYISNKDLREIKGSYLEISSKPFYEKQKCDDYIHAILTDEDDVMDAMNSLRHCYPNIMKLSYENRRTMSDAEYDKTADVENKSELELFEELFEMQNSRSLSESQEEYLAKLIDELKQEGL